MHLLLILSLLSWERGLKSYRSICDIRRLGVAPLVGAWIEIRALAMKILEETVAPLVGAWIEIIRAWFIGYFLTVAPLVGAWIEIESIVILSCVISCRSSRGSVD